MTNQLPVNDFHMAYREAGRGQPLVLVHGFPLNSRLWEPQLAGLSRSFRVIAPDLRGHGASSTPPGYEPYTMDQLADDLAALLDGLGISSPVILGGLSMGGYVAFAFCRKYPDRLGGLLLAATRAAPDSQQAAAARAETAAKVMGEGIQVVVESMLPKMLAPAAYQSQPGLVAEARAIMENTSQNAVVGDLLGLKDRPDSNPTLPTIRVPTLVLHGDADQIIPLGEAQAMAAAIPNARLVVVHGAGHLLNLEAPDRFNQAALEYFSKSS